jgi:hypothetical protein
MLGTALHFLYLYLKYEPNTQNTEPSIYVLKKV